MTRRKFILALGCGAGAELLPPRSFSQGSAAAPLAGAAPGTAGDASALQAVQQTASAFGAEARLLVLHPQRETATRAIAAALAELRKAEDIMSLYRPGSELCRLNRDGVFADPHPYLVEVLRKSQKMSELSRGAFDVTVQPLWELYAAAKKAGRTPSASEIRTARSKVDWRQVEVGADRIRLKRRGMKVTLNAMAQGFAADRVLAVLRQAGVEHALVNTGEIGALGSKAGGEPWTVGIQHPRRADAYVALAKLVDCCLATSGDYATSFDDGHLRHHIFDPVTGRSPAELASVTVVARSGADADALATAVFVLGTRKGLRLLREFPGAEAFLVRKDGSTTKTRGFPEVEPDALNANQKSDDETRH